MTTSTGSPKWRTHEAYIQAVAEALGRHWQVDEWHADDNDPRDGNISLVDRSAGRKPIWDNDEVNVAWSEDRGWALVTVADSSSSDGRFVYELPIATVASPSTVALAVADKLGNVLDEFEPDGHPDADFPDHDFYDDDPEFEAALARYREAP